MPLLNIFYRSNLFSFRLHAVVQHPPCHHGEHPGEDNRIVRPFPPFHRIDQTVLHSSRTHSQPPQLLLQSLPLHFRSSLSIRHVGIQPQRLPPLQQLPAIQRTAPPNRFHHQSLRQLQTLPVTREIVAMTQQAAHPARPARQHHPFLSPSVKQFPSDLKPPRHHLLLPCHKPGGWRYFFCRK